MKNFSLQKKGGQKGFTLIETLVAITILMVAITGPLVFVSGAVSQALYAKDQITAFYLAQDAVEQIRNIRDTIAIQERDGTYVPSDAPGAWLENPTPNSSGGTLDLTDCLGGSSCVISTANAGESFVKKCTTLDGSGNPICPALSYDTNTFEYGYLQSSGYGELNGDTNPSIYTRTVKITELVPNNEAQVAVTISWSAQNIGRTFTVVEDLFNWAGQ